MKKKSRPKEQWWAKAITAGTTGGDDLHLAPILQHPGPLWRKGLLFSHSLLHLCHSPLNYPFLSMSSFFPPLQKLPSMSNGHRSRLKGVSNAKSGKTWIIRWIKIIVELTQRIKHLCTHTDGRGVLQVNSNWYM